MQLHALNKRARAVFEKITEGLRQLGDHRKIANAEGFMPVCVEIVDRNRLGNVVSVAHYYEQNGDLMADPDMTFLVVEGPEPDARAVYPLTYYQPALGIYQETAAVTATGLRLAPRMQRDITRFANQWMTNIRQQQFCRG